MKFDDICTDDVQEIHKPFCFPLTVRLYPQPTGMAHSKAECAVALLGHATQEG
jgi:hypothetical protein